jgi:hypothetical protein
MDRISPKQRSWTMSRVRSHNTGPQNSRAEGGARSRAALPSSPKRFAGDAGSEFSQAESRALRTWMLLAPARGMQCRNPKPRIGQKNFNGTLSDRKADAALEAVGWLPMTIWECQTNDRAKLAKLSYDLFACRKRSSRNCAGNVSKC